jgi:prefoldin subunit 5
MAEVCKDIDQGLAALNRKIDEQNRRLGQLEQIQKQCCDKNNNNKNSNDLEYRIKKIENYIESLEKGLDIVVTVLNSIKEIIKKFFK